MSYLVFNKGTKGDVNIPDSQLIDALHIIFPDENKWFYTVILKRIQKEGVWGNNQYSITHSSYETRLMKPAYSWHRKLKSFGGAPRNNSPITVEPIHNEWLMFNVENEKTCSFGNLAALARAIDVRYSYLYAGINTHSVFAIGKYRFSRNSKLEKNHVLSLLVDVL